MTLEKSMNFNSVYFPNSKKLSRVLNNDKKNALLKFALESNTLIEDKVRDHTFFFFWQRRCKDGATEKKQATNKIWE